MHTWLLVAYIPCIISNLLTLSFSPFFGISKCINEGDSCSFGNWVTDFDCGRTFFAQEILLWNLEFWHLVLDWIEHKMTWESLSFFLFFFVFSPVGRVVWWIVSLYRQNTQNHAWLPRMPLGFLWWVDSYVIKFSPIIWVVG